MMRHSCPKCGEPHQKVWRKCVSCGRRFTLKDWHDQRNLPPGPQIIDLPGP